jgi:monofunctional glycosyltransferase
VATIKKLILTWFMELRLSKSRILELYLNSIEWGHGIFGIEAAAQRYFQKPASQLTTDEAARLAAVIPSPLRHRPTDHSEYVVKKKDLILQRMASR